MGRTPIVSLIHGKDKKSQDMKSRLTSSFNRPKTSNVPNTPAGNMGRFIDSALSAKAGKQAESEDLISNRANEIDNDPVWQMMRNMAMSQWNNPGISQSLIDRLKGQAAARSAAQASGAARNIMAQLARGNISGSAAANYAALMNNQAAINRNKGNLDIDLANAQMAQSGRNTALGNLQNIAGNQHNMQNRVAQLLAALKSQYNPMNDMRSAQGLTQPIQELAALVAQRRR